MKLFIHITKFTLTILAVLAIIASLIWGWHMLDVNKEFIMPFLCVLLSIISIPLISVMAVNAFTLKFDNTKGLITISLASYILMLPLGQVLQYFFMNGTHIEADSGATFNYNQQIFVDWLFYGFLALAIIIMGVFALMLLAYSIHLIYKGIIALWHWYE